MRRRVKRWGLGAVQSYIGFWFFVCDTTKLKKTSHYLHTRLRVRNTWYRTMLVFVNTFSKHLI